MGACKQSSDTGVVRLGWVRQFCIHDVLDQRLGHHLGFRAAVLGHLERGSEAKAALDRYLSLRPNLKVCDDYRRIFVPNSALADPIIEGLVKAGWEPEE